jgi:uncharacterized membrane protein
MRNQVTLRLSPPPLIAEERIAPVLVLTTVSLKELVEDGRPSRSDRKPRTTHNRLKMADMAGRVVEGSLEA